MFNAQMTIQFLKRCKAGKFTMILKKLITLSGRKSTGSLKQPIKQVLATPIISPPALRKNLVKTHHRLAYYQMKRS